MKQILTLYFGLVFSLCCYAEDKVHWPLELYKNAHPTSSKTPRLNWMKYFIDRDFREALIYAEGHLLQRDLPSLTPQEFANEIKTIARILIQHDEAESAAIKPDELVESAFALFRTHAYFSDLQLSTGEECLTEIPYLQGEYDINYLMPVEQQWDQAKGFEEKYRYDQSLALSSSDLLREHFNSMVAENRGDILEGLLGRIVCVSVERATLRSHETSPFRTGGIFIFDDQCSVNLRHLGFKKYAEFIIAMLAAENNDETWSYPNIAVRLSSIKDIDASILTFASSTLEKIKNANPYEAAAFAHQEWVRLHPMVDGNGRMGRLLANLILIKAGMDPLIVHDDSLYNEATQQGLKEQFIFEKFLRHSSKTPGLNANEVSYAF